jgi:hypothetical protein
MQPSVLWWLCVVPCLSPLGSILGTPSIKGYGLQQVMSAFVLVMGLALFERHRPACGGLR